MSAKRKQLMFAVCAFLIISAFNFLALADPDIDIWYGSHQKFGYIGKPQNYANIFGDVSGPFSITSLQYSLNGDPNVSLTIGPDGRRLVSTGDFNIDIPWENLVDGNNIISITATDVNSDVSISDVNINFDNMNVWPLPYTADWNDANTIEEVAQVVDGNWVIYDSNVRTEVSGYDRLIAIGDVTWTDYEITAPITIHDISSGSGVGFVLRWTGHTDQGASCLQPKCGYLPLGEIPWYKGSGRIEMYQDRTTEYKSMNLLENEQYMFKARVETLNDGNCIYSMKVWHVDTNEPQDWDLISIPEPADLPSGCALLIAHQCDVSYGKVEIEPVGIKNLILDINDTNVMFKWQTTLPTDSNLSYGLSSSYTDSMIDLSLLTEHAVEINNLTPHTTYHYQITSIDSNNVVSQTKDLTFKTTGPDISGIISDDFDSQVIDSNIWVFEDPIGDCDFDLNGVGTNDAWLKMHVPAGVDHDPHTGKNRAYRLMQDANDVDFEIEAKFESDLTTNHQIEGLLIQQDVNNWIRFDFHARDANVHIYVAAYEDDTQTINPVFDNIIDPILDPNANPIWAKLKREANHWTMWYSANGMDWTYVTDFSYTFTVNSVGILAGNAKGTSSPAFTCNVDYFFNTASPISNEDAKGEKPPVLDPIGNQTVIAGEILDVNTHASDPCDQALFFTTYDFPSFADFNDHGDGNALLHLEPNLPDVGIYTVAVRVTDPCGLFDEESFQIYVNNPNETSGIVSDDFHTGILNTNIWEFIDPVGDCNYTLTGAGTADAWFDINVPGGTEHQIWNVHGIQAPHLVQNINDVNFEVETKIESTMHPAYQEQGIIVKGSDGKFMRLEIYSNNGSYTLFTHWFEPSDDGGTSKSLGSTLPQYVRVKRTGDIWEHYFSHDANTWETGNTITFDIDVNEVGIYGGNGTGGNSPQFLARFDYFMNTAAPIIDEDPLADSDGDGILDGDDNCPGIHNPDQNDIDTDGFGNLCDNCPDNHNPDQNDIDLDGIGDLCDNCPDVNNPDQNDIDLDGIGNECECRYANLDATGPVDIFDYAVLTLHWFQAGPDGDANKDGIVDSGDLEQLCQWWLKECD